MKYAVLAFALTAPTAALTEGNATCLGWQLDRANLATMIEKQHDLRNALLTVQGGEQEELASQLAKNLSAFIEAAESAYGATQPIFEASCKG